MQENWWPPKRRLRLVAALVQTVAAGTAAALKLADGELPLGLLTLAVAVCGAFLALDAARTRVETNAEGLRVVTAFSSTRIPWPEIAELRPNARAPWADRLVVVKQSGDIVKLPIPPTDEVIHRWTRATTH
jgi:hypothetical protein